MVYLDFDRFQWALNRMCNDLYLQVLRNLYFYFSQKYLFIKIIQRQIEILTQQDPQFDWSRT